MSSAQRAGLTDLLRDALKPLKRQVFDACGVQITYDKDSRTADQKAASDPTSP